MRFVGDLVGRVWHACRFTVIAGLPGEIGQLQQLNGSTFCRCMASTFIFEVLTR